MEGKMEKKIDVRIIQLAKWQIPKSKKVLNGEAGGYLSIGYFDMVSVKKVEAADGQHPLMSAYRESPRRAQNDREVLPMDDYTVQEMIVFTDVNRFGREGDAADGEKRIEDFWKAEDLLLYISLIHVDNESDLGKITLKIDTLFSKIKHLYYFSLDYSGIVIVAKGSRLQEYLRLMFRLNYDNQGGEKLIRDSYSFYGFNRQRLNVYCDQFAQMPYGEVAVTEAEETFSASVNIGIQNYNTYVDFLNELKEVDPEIRNFGLFGRHDVSVVNDRADLKWLIYVQYLLDKYTDIDACYGSNKLLSTHETFIKLDECDGLADTKDNVENPYYGYVEKRLSDLESDFSKRLNEKKDKYNGEYKIPVQAVVYSILSIMKNRFAEDFVLCMYQSFTDFLIYLTKKMEDSQDQAADFDKCYRNYFLGLNSLVNSAMHSERQFIQATAFNAIIYDVPSKIMAFYIAVIDDIQNVMRGSKDKKYTFLLTPSFCNEISVEIISYKNDAPPHDRILMVSINEESLYNPRGVVRRMAHEIAHYVGDELRNRPLRKSFLKSSFIYLVLSHLLYRSFLEADAFYDLIDEIEGLLPSCQVFEDEKKNYSYNLQREVCIQVGEQFKRNERIKDALKNYIYKILEEILNGKGEKGELRKYLMDIVRSGPGAEGDYLMELVGQEFYSQNELFILRDLIWQDIQKELRYLNKDRDMLLEMGEISQSVILKEEGAILKDTTLGEYGKRLTMAYSEAFADIQMILLLDISYTDYLKGFLWEEKVVLEELPHRGGDLMRISMVALTLQSVGFWSCRLEGNAEQDSEIVRFHGMLQRHIRGAWESLEDDGSEKEAFFQLVSDFRRETESGYEVFEGIGGDISETGESNETADKGHIFLNGCIYEYLLECLKESINHYLKEEKSGQIIQLRRVIETVTKCENVFDMFSVICTEINEYKQKIMDEAASEEEPQQNPAQ